MKKIVIFSAISLIVVIVGLAILLKFWPGAQPSGAKETIKVGILHSLTGTMAISEMPVVDAVLLAIQEINSRGGVLGKSIQPIIADGRSDPEIFKKKAEELITKDHVSVIFGCWTSSSRKAVKPIIEQHKALLIYPVQYEGLEKSPNILYTGAAPNQQIIPAIKWLSDTLKPVKYFLVGSDYIFPHMANAIIKDQVSALHARVVAEEYLPLGSFDVDSIIKKISSENPDVIINTINGDSNIAFFKALKNLGISSEKIPVMSFSISENMVRGVGPELLQGHYASWNYFQSIDNKKNKDFVEAFQKEYGRHRLTSDPMEAGYFGVYLWSSAVEKAGSPSPDLVINSLKSQKFDAPEGMVSVDPETMHTWKTARIGKLKPDGQFEVVWSSNSPIKPNPFPETRTVEEWTKFLNDYLEHESKKVGH